MSAIRILRSVEFKALLREQGIPVQTFESSIAWSDFKLNSDGMVPVIVQDYKTDEVLMLAYMNEEAFETTLKSGKMTYWSRSRNELWTKGLTSGHLQYVKSLTLDCDNDTILAKVSQIGAACHTGNRTCFFKTLVKKEYDDTNPLRVFQDVYDVIMDRKETSERGFLYQLPFRQRTGQDPEESRRRMYGDRHCSEKSGQRRSEI